MADNNQIKIKSTPEEDLKLLKQVFKGNPNLLQTLQDMFLGFEMTDSEKSLVKTAFESDDLYRIFKKKLTPRLEKGAMVGQQSDQWAGLEKDVYGAARDTIYQAVHYKKEAMALAEKAVALLKNPEGERPNLNFEPDLNAADPLQINLLARNMYIAMVQQQLAMIWVMVEQHEGESPQETAKRISQDSAK